MNRWPIMSACVLILIYLVAMQCGAESFEKPRMVVMTDVGGDPDDRQSMVRFLLYSCEFEVEGLCTGFGHGHYEVTRPDLIREAVDAYGKVLPNLRRHRSDYPSHEHLMSLIKDGHNGDPHKVGSGMDSEASEWIIKVLDRDDPRPVWFSIWGGPRELAQAIWKVQQTRTAKELAAFKSKIRVHSIADQDRTAGWVKKNHPDVFWIYSNKLFRGIWREGDQSLVSTEWLKEHVPAEHGPLGKVYPEKAAGKEGVKEGDTPSFFYLLPNGLSDPMHPEWGNWGGRFRRSGSGREYIPDEDWMKNRPDMMYTIHRWRRAYQNAFEARMDWCVMPYEKANHEPAAVCNGDRSRSVLQMTAEPGSTVELTAAGSSDPDGDTLSYKWWAYTEAGSYPADIPIRDAEKVVSAIEVPKNASGRTVHIILEVVDHGSPPLTAYRRAILKVTGDPVDVQTKRGVYGSFLRKPVTKLDGPEPRSGKWTFHRGVNINGPAIKIDGNKWDGDSAAGFICSDKSLNSPHVKLIPPTDKQRAKMIHSFRWNRRAGITLKDLPTGEYAVYAYVWEETSPETITISMQSKVVEKNRYTGRRGLWQRLGPWMTRVDDGTIKITSEGGAANFSGVEVWKKRYMTPPSRLSR